MELKFREIRDIDIFKEKYKNGDIFIFPTETVYGIGTYYKNVDSIEKIYELKKRDEKPLALYFYDFNETLPFIEIDERIIKIAERFLPGPLTLICNAKKDLGSRLILNGKVGIRIPSDKIIRKILREISLPVAATSANLSGKKSIINYEELDSELVKNVDISINGGTIKGGIESTIIDLTQKDIIILRDGYIRQEVIFNFLKENGLQ